MSRLKQLERQNYDLVGDIQDVLDAAALNLKALGVELQKDQAEGLQDVVSYLEKLLVDIRNNLLTRPSLFIGHLVSKQIKDQEEKVRRDRLIDYQEKIYDQRRIIADKESFFESLLRPKKKRMATQTPQEFQESRTRERDAEQRTKTDTLNKELLEYLNLRRSIDEQEKMRKKQELESTKSSSISQVSITILGDSHEVVFSHRAVTLDEQSEHSTKNEKHIRHVSLQPYIGKDTSPSKDNNQLDYKALYNIIQQILTLQKENQELQRLYNQEQNVLQYKQTKRHRIKEQYDSVLSQIKTVQAQINQAKIKQSWRYNRALQPIKQRRRTSLSKY